MPRRNTPKPRSGSTRRVEPEPGSARSLGERSETWRGVEYRVRAVSGSTSTTPYRCPGCDQLLSPRSGHVVAWPADDLEASDRRHWHSSCWAARETRAPGIQRSRNAPRHG